MLSVPSNLAFNYSYGYRPCHSRDTADHFPCILIITDHLPGGVLNKASLQLKSETEMLVSKYNTNGIMQKEMNSGTLD